MYSIDKRTTTECVKKQLLLDAFLHKSDIHMTFMCDVCMLDHGDSRECLDNMHCTKCDTYYDKCESHKGFIECPFCKRKKAKSQGGEEEEEE